jgi:formamidopyrimidine-DNA glycosylase
MWYARGDPSPMPELPEVEHARRCLEQWMIGRVITRVLVPKSRLLRGASPERVRRLLKGQRAARIERRGKHLLAVFESDRALHLHFGMSGRLVLRAAGAPMPDHARLALDLDDRREIVFRDPRMFGRIDVGEAAALRRTLLEPLGRDPWLEPPSGADLLALFANTSRPVKVALLDQTLLAGVGNIHAAEALWIARIHPGRAASSLNARDASRLAKAIARTFARALEDLREDSEGGEGDVAYLQDDRGDNPFFIYGRAGERCPRCRDVEIESIEQAQRVTFFCPTCQVDSSTGLSSREVRAKVRTRARTGEGVAKC